MKSVFFLISFIAVIIVSSVANAQAPAAVQPSNSNSSSQWVSHQMNQPLPGPGDKNNVSQDRLDEIQQLYLQAKKERDAKADPTTPDKK